MQRRLKHSITLEDAYKAHKKNTDKDKRLSKQQFSTLFNTYLEGCVEEIVHKGILWKLPYNLGEIYVEKIYRPKYVNWKESKRTGKKVYSFNDHTRGFIYALVWNKPNRDNNTRFCDYAIQHPYKRYMRNTIVEYSDNGESLPAFNVVDRRKDSKPIKRPTYK